MRNLIVIRFPKVMNRYISYLTFLIFGIISASAQMGEQRHDFSIGANAGYICNKVSFTPKINQKFYTAPTFGITLRYTSERYYGMICAFQAELNYSGMGWKEDIFSYRNEMLPDTYERQLSYIQVPILAHLGFGKIDRGFKGYLVAGPQVGFLISDKEKMSDEWTVSANGIPDRLNGVVAQYGLKVENSFEYGITAGLGAELSTKAGRILLEGRYYMGLSNLFGNAKTDPFPRSSNGAIIAKVTYLIDLFH